MRAKEEPSVLSWQQQSVLSMGIDLPWRHRRWGKPFSQYVEIDYDYFKKRASCIPVWTLGRGQKITLVISR